MPMGFFTVLGKSTSFAGCCEYRSDAGRLSGGAKQRKSVCLFSDPPVIDDDHTGNGQSQERYENTPAKPLGFRVPFFKAVDQRLQLRELLRRQHESLHAVFPAAGAARLSQTKPPVPDELVDLAQ